MYVSYISQIIKDYKDVGIKVFLAGCKRKYRICRLSSTLLTTLAVVISLHYIITESRVIDGALQTNIEIRVSVFKNSYINLVFKYEYITCIHVSS